jgi:anaerobic ribonucleoside-triphosphate reductase
MQPISRRVRTIYSVIASSNRLEILRILNTKGPLSYSELKTLAGFKSKKESGKFAYHLRKLVRQMLINLNRQERKYTVTSLGRLVLNLTRQIEEQSVVESGKIYVRTSRQTMEEFNSDKILQSLVREAGMPVELAHRITSETESRLYKFQTIYLTSPLIREMVNALLVEHGLEEYRHKLTRLGLPIYDISELVNNTGQGEGDVKTVLAKTASSVFAEFLMLSQLSRDVADSHLAGDMHISNAGSWGLMPDTVFFDLMTLQSHGINMGGKLPVIPRIDPPQKLEDALNSLVLLGSVLSREVSNEISFEHLTPYIARYAQEKTKEELRDALRRAFSLIPPVTGGYGTPTISFQVDWTNRSSRYDDTLVRRIFEAISAAYDDYVRNVAVPVISLVLNSDSDVDPELGKMVGSIVSRGGKISVSLQPDIVQSFSGLRRDSGKRFPADGVKILHSLSLNLPRLSYESNRDETYFRAKLNMILKTAITALQTRKKMISNLSKQNLLPAITGNPPIVSEEYVPLTVNLTGMNEAVSRMLGERTSAVERWTLIEKIVETATKGAEEIGANIEEAALVAMIRGDSGQRFASMDLEKYGRSIITTSLSRGGYSEAFVVTLADLTKSDLMKGLARTCRELTGGCAVDVDLPNGSLVETLSEIIGKAGKSLDFFRFARKMAVCRVCGARFSEGTERCNSCQSTSMRTYSTV